MKKIIFLVPLFFFVNASPLNLEPCDQVDKLKPDPLNCSRFYECTLAGWVREDCNTGLDFNPNTLQCDYPYNVDCPNKNGEIAFKLDPCDDVGNLKPDPLNCSRFYECTHAGWVKLNCYPGLYFNEITSQCDYPENVDCPNNNNNVKTGLQNEPCGDLPLNGLKPDPKNCSQFIQCAPQGLVTLPCPRNLLFNPDTLHCDYPDNVQCASSLSSSYKFLFSGKNLKWEDCGDLALNQLAPDPLNCNRFLQCAPGGRVISMPCPAGLEFNPELLVCDYPESVRCNATFLRNLQNEPCGDLPLNGLKPDPKNCSQFIQCAPQGLVTLPCPRNLVFNPDTLHCDYPDNVQCASSLSSSHKSYGNDPCDPEEIDKLFPDPNSCSRFLQCSPLGLVSLPCPDPLVFNPDTGMCDYPEKVNCVPPSVEVE